MMKLEEYTYIASELEVDSELLQTGALLLLFLKEALNTCCLFLVGALAVLLVAELDLGGNKLPLAISVLEHVLVGLVHHVAVQLLSEHDIAVHCLRGNLGDLFVLEFQKGIASGPGSLYYLRVGIKVPSWTWTL